MAPRLPKRPLEASDFKDPNRLMEALNPLLTVLPAALDKGLTLNNLAHRYVSTLVTVPEDWAPLTLATGWIREPEPTIPAPSFRYVSETEVAFRGAVQKVGSAPIVVGEKLIQSIPPGTGRETHAVDASGDFARIDTWPQGYATVVSAASTTHISLTGIRYETSAPRPMWPQPSERDIHAPGELDWGEPALVLALYSERADKATTKPELLPHWETPLVGERRSQRRVLRLKRVDGLRPGKQTVTCLLLYP